MFPPLLSYQAPAERGNFMCHDRTEEKKLTFVLYIEPAKVHSRNGRSQLRTKHFRS